MARPTVGNLPARCELPSVAINVAMSADGKLAPASRQFVPFTTPRDHELLYELRSRADAVMTGATTVEMGEISLDAGGEKYRRKRRARGLSEEPLRIVVSGSGRIDPSAHIFTTRSSPILLLTTARAGRRLKSLQKLAAAIHVSRGGELDFREALVWLRREWGVKQLLCEGGGELNSALIEAGLVDEIHLTIAPLILGGQNAPTLCDGQGIANLIEARGVAIRRIQRVGDELYTTFRVASRDLRKA